MGEGNKSGMLCSTDFFSLAHSQLTSRKGGNGLFQECELYTDFFRFLKTAVITSQRKALSLPWRIHNLSPRSVRGRRLSAHPSLCVLSAPALFPSVTEKCATWSVQAFRHRTEIPSNLCFFIPFVKSIHTRVKSIHIGCRKQTHLALKCMKVILSIKSGGISWLDFVDTFLAESKGILVRVLPQCLSTNWVALFYVTEALRGPKTFCPICTTQPFVLEGCGEARMTVAFCEHATAMHPSVRVCILCTWSRREAFVGAGRQKTERRVFAEACVINSSWGKSWELGERLCLLVEFSNTPPPLQAG